MLQATLGFSRATCTPTHGNPHPHSWVWVSRGFSLKYFYIFNNNFFCLFELSHITVTLCHSCLLKNNVEPPHALTPHHFQLPPSEHIWGWKLQNTRKVERRKWDTKRTGPNNARCIVWAPGECLFFSFMFFIIMSVLLQYILVVTYGIQGRNSAGRWQQTKRAQMTPDASFGP